MIPSPLVLLVLVLASWRVWRLVALDDFPPVVWARNRAVGVTWTEEGLPVFARPMLAKFIPCPWCSGFWIGAAWYVAWIVWPTCALYAAVPFAMNTVWATLQSVLPD